MKLVVSDEAAADLEAAAAWYIEQDAWHAALALHEETRLALARLMTAPGLGTPGPVDTRILPIRRFPLSIVYRVAGGELQVIAVAAHRRRPDFWRGRAGE